MKMNKIKIGLIGFLIILVGIFVMAGSLPPTDIDFNRNTTATFDNNGDFDVNFSAGGDDPAMNYSIYISIDGETSIFKKGVNDSLTGFTFINATNANYTFQIAAVNATDNESINSTALYMNIDTIKPLIDYGINMEVNNSNMSQTYIFVNVSVIELNEDYINFSLYNTTKLVNSTVYDTAIRSINWTTLPDEVYTYNVTINDSATNTNTTITQWITLDTTLPTLTVGLPDGLDVTSTTMVINITSNEICNSCNYSMNGTATNISIPTPNNLSFWNTITTPSDGYHTVVFYCSDKSGNINTTTSSTFLVREWIGGGSAASSGYLLVDVGIINLSSVEIISDSPVFFGKKFAVILRPSDINDSIIPVDVVSLDLQDNITYSAGNLLLQLNGDYKRDFIVNEQNITNITIEAYVMQGTKEINETRMIRVTDASFIDKNRLLFEEFGNDFGDFIVEYWLYLIIFGMIFLFIIISFVLIKKVNDVK